MEALFNGCLRLAFSTAAWAKACNGRNSWGHGIPNPDLSLADAADADALYTLIETR